MTLNSAMNASPLPKVVKSFRFVISAMCTPIPKLGRRSVNFTFFALSPKRVCARLLILCPLVQAMPYRAAQRCVSCLSAQLTAPGGAVSLNTLSVCLPRGPLSRCECGFFRPFLVPLRPLLLSDLSRYDLVCQGEFLRLTHRVPHGKGSGDRPFETLVV